MGIAKATGQFSPHVGSRRSFPATEPPDPRRVSEGVSEGFSKGYRRVLQGF